MIVIVTGMREWKNKDQVWRELDELLENHSASWLASNSIHDGKRNECSVASFHREMLKAFILRHGKSGNVDIWADYWGRERGVTIEGFQAEWRLPGGGTDFSAGPRRNRSMAAAEPKTNLCLAFWDGTFQVRGKRSVSGTHDMILAALVAGIPVSIKPPETLG